MRPHLRGVFGEIGSNSSNHWSDAEFDFVCQKPWKAAENDQASQQKSIRQSPPESRGVSQLWAFLFAMPDAANGAEHVNAADYERAPDREDRHKRGTIPVAEKDEGLAGKTGKSRHTATGQHRHDHDSADERQSRQQAAQLGNFEGLNFVAQVSRQPKSQRREKTVRDNPNSGFSGSDKTQARDAKK